MPETAPRVVNIMLSRRDGGLERMALHQAKGLAQCGHPVTTLLHPEAAVWPLARRLGLAAEAFGWTSRWNPLAGRLLGRRIDRLGADLVLVHGNRAMQLACRAARRRWPVVAVAHSTWTKPQPGLGGVVSLTPDGVEQWRRRGIASAFAPNFLADDLPPVPPRPLRQPPVIGGLGRLVAKKGFADLLDAAAILRGQGRSFQLLIGGSGAEAEALERQAEAHGLAEEVRFAGWIADSAAFLKELDIFVLPSREEPFGIVVLEAWRAGLPVVATETAGPRSFIQAGSNGLLVPVGSPAALAAALAELLDDGALALNLAQRGQEVFMQRYAASGGAALSRALQDILKQASA